MNAHLIDALIAQRHLRCDAALARALEVPRSYICKWRSNRIGISDGSLIRIEEEFDMPIAQQKRLIALEALA